MSDNDDVRAMFHDMRTNLIKSQLGRLVDAAGGEVDDTTRRALREVVAETGPDTINALVALLERLRVSWSVRRTMWGLSLFHDGQLVASSDQLSELVALLPGDARCLVDLAAASEAGSTPDRPTDMTAD